MEYAAIWPITDPDRTDADLIGEALPDLRDLLEEENLAQAGDIIWHRSAGHLAARTPVEYDDPPDAMPWESRRAWAGQLAVA